MVGVVSAKGRQYGEWDRPDDRLLMVPLITAERRLGFDEEDVAVLLVYPRPGAERERTRLRVLEDLGPRSASTRTTPGPSAGRITRPPWASSSSSTSASWSSRESSAPSAGLGMANYQLAVLAERILEIAIAKTVGARNRDLMLQAALEALVPTAGLAVLGAGLGVATAYLRFRSTTSSRIRSSRPLR